MNEDYIKRLDFDSETFEDMKTDMNFILQRMLGSMIEKNSTEGCMTIKIDINMVQEWIPNNAPDIEGETRMIRKPQFKHKCTSSIKITDEKVEMLNNEMELDIDNNGCYYLKPIVGTMQMSIFDKDFQTGINKPEDGAIIDARESDIKEISGINYPALTCGDTGKPDNTEPDCVYNAPDGLNQGENKKDNISEDNKNDTEIDATEAPFGNDIGDNSDEENDREPDDYGYEEPEEE